MTTSTKDKQDSEDKPIRRKKLSSNSKSIGSSSKDYNSKKSNIKIIELAKISSLDNKELVKLAKEKKIKENPKDRTDLVNMLVAIEAEEKNATIGAGILDILPDQFGFLRPPGQKNSPNDIHVSRGSLVEKGELIGTVGNTGLSTGPHLHWSVLLNNTYIDPLGLVKKSKVKLDN